MTGPASRAELYIGLMSGTSLDGIDIAIVSFTDTAAEVLHCETVPYPATIRSKLRQLNHNQKLSFDTLYSLDVELGELYARTTLSLLADHHIGSEQIAAIGCHGQTLQHKPDAEPPYTVQIGDPNVIAARTRIDTVADFRRKDVALGGQGAPLAPLFHEFLFADTAEHRVVINIGGIANISCLSASTNGPRGFDTGPGNTLMDYWIATHQGKTFDEGGSWASSGQLQTGLLHSMLQAEPYFSAEPPKTTGTEYFSPAWLEKHKIGDFRPQDVQTTLCELTAITIANDIRECFPQCDCCFVCGGGAANEFLLSRITALIPDCPVKTTETLGIDPNFVEAIGFAWLARQRLHKQPVNLPPVTGSSRPGVIGGIYSGR